MHCRLWLRPQAAKTSPEKEGSDPKWAAGEATYAFPVHLRTTQALTVGVLDKDNIGADEIGRCSHLHAQSHVWLHTSIQVSHGR